MSLDCERCRADRCAECVDGSEFVGYKPTNRYPFQNGAAWVMVRKNGKYNLTMACIKAGLTTDPDGGMGK